MVLRKLSHCVELRLAWVALLALFFAQLGAVAHAYSHDAAAGQATSQRVGANTHNPCGECLAFAPLLAGAAAPAVLPSIAPPIPFIADSLRAPLWVVANPHLAFRSRAPPSTP